MSGHGTTTPAVSWERPNHRRAAMQLCGSLSRHGVDPLPLLEQAGVEHARLNEALYRVNNTQMILLLKAARSALRDDLYGFAERRIRPGTLHYMFELGLRCDTLQALIEHCMRFLDLLVEEIGVALRQDQGEAVLCIRLMRPELDPDHFLADQMLLYWHRILSWSVGYLIPIHRLHVMLQELPNPERHAYWICRDWMPGQAENALYFDPRYLALPVVRTPQQWQEQVVQRGSGLPALPEGEQGWSLRLRAQLHDTLMQARRPCSLEEAALALGIGPRTLRRQLDREGTSFQQVLDGLLHDEAIERLHVQRLSVSDVAEQLGFAEPRSFSRAFKRWTGVSPLFYSR